MTKQQKTIIKIPKEIGDTQRQILAREVMDFIIERTQKGLDRNNEKFKRADSMKGKSGNYTKGYRKSLDFAIAGKDDKIDLTLSGDMLNDMSLVDDKPGKLVIGYHKGYSGMGKVEGNRLGTYGQDKAVTPPRDFLGISDNDLTRILTKYKVNAILEEEVIQDYTMDVLDLIDFEAE